MSNLRLKPLKKRLTRAQRLRRAARIARRVEPLRVLESLSKD